MPSLRRAAHRAFGALGVEVTRKRSDVTGPIVDHFEPVRDDEPLPILEEHERLWIAYRDHELTNLSGHIWDQETDSPALTDIDPRRFRGDNAFIWQGRLHSAATYALSALWAERSDRCGVLDRTRETGAFGADCIRLGDRLWSRDLIDSTLEINFLVEVLPAGYLDDQPIVDIGAGYGRLVQRLAGVTTNPTLVAVDGIALSTAICRAYVAHLELSERVQVLDLPSLDAYGGELRLATNVHSFSEMSPAAVDWWLRWLTARGVEHLFVVPNVTGPALNDGTDLTPMFARHGFHLAAHRRKYTDPLVDEFAMYQADYYLFSR